MNVLVIPEDFRKDQHMLKPIIEGMMQAIGQPRARVRVCQDPKLGGISQATNWEEIEAILDRYQYRVNLFLLCVDRDGQEGRRATLDHLEAQASAMLPVERKLLASNAIEEIEVWVLAGCQDFLDGTIPWASVRIDLHPKENHYLPFARRRGVIDQLSEGRKTLGEEAGRNYNRVRRLCEEVTALEAEVTAWMGR